MRAALVVNRVTPDPAANLSAIVTMAHEAASASAKSIVFPAAAATGLINKDDPSHDLALGQPIPSRITDAVAAVSRQRRAWLAAGVLERDDGRLYDSAVWLGPKGEIALKCRRIQLQWHGTGADPRIYCQGRRSPRQAHRFAAICLTMGSCAG